MLVVKIFIIIISIVIIIYTPQLRTIWDKHMFMWGYNPDDSSKIMNVMRETLNRIFFLAIIIITLLDLVGIVQVYPI